MERRIILDKLLIGFIGIFILAFIFTIIINIWYAKRNKKDREACFTKEKLEEYEKILDEYLKKNGIKDKEINSILKHIGYEVVEKDNIRDNHEAYIENKTIFVDKKLGFRVKNFGIAHEVAHIIRGGNEAVARDPHSFRRRTVEEQICDYIAAALLLPLQDMRNRMSKIEYDKITKTEKMRFITELAEEKNVCEEVVIRRIEEIQLISK